LEMDDQPVPLCCLFQEALDPMMRPGANPDDRRSAGWFLDAAPDDWVKENFPKYQKAAADNLASSHGADSNVTKRRTKKGKDRNHSSVVHSSPDERTALSILQRKQQGSVQGKSYLEHKGAGSGDEEG